MKRITAIFVGLLLCATMLTGVVSAAGKTEIKSAADLNAVRNNLDGNFILKNDITFSAGDFTSGGAFYNDGRGFLPIGNEENAFTGTFDGNGHTITGLQITASAVKQEDSMYAGLFGNIGGTAVIKNLCLKNVKISFTIPQDVSGIVTLETDIGGICAVCGENAKVENCAVSGSISATVSVSTTVKVGGIAGSNYGIISNCSGTASVSAQSPWKVYAGGITGYQHGTLTQCWANATIGGTATYSFCGTLVGYSVNVNTTKCYYANHGVSAFGHVKSSESATALSLPTQISKLTGLDTATVWTLDTNGAPILRLFSGQITPPSKDAAKDFIDVSKKDWFYQAVNFAYRNNLFGGVGGGKFAPNDNMTRGMFVTVLGRLYGVSVNHNITTKFTDVKKGQWYTGYVKWASDNGIVSGMSATTFAPNANVTREQICKMMIEYCNFVKIKLKSMAAPLNFADAGKISGWAKGYVTKCQTAGLVGGTVKGGKTYFDPLGFATRAQVAQILYNFSQNYL